MSTTESVGSRIRRLRRAAGLSQEALAQPDLSASYISLLEAGKRLPSGEVLAQLAERLGCTPAYLVDGVDKPDTGALEVELRYAELTLRNGDAATALTGFEQVLEKLSPTEHRSLWISASLGVAQCHEHEGRLEEATTRLEELRRRTLTAEPELPQRLALVMSLCRCYRELGDLSHAIEVAEGTVAEIEALDLPPTTASVELLSTLIGIYAERGDLNRAGYLASRAVDQAQLISDRKALGAAYWNASVVLHRQGRSGEALSLITKAVAIYSEGDDERALARIRNAYAAVLLQSDPDDAQTATARSLLEQSVSVLTELGSTTDVAHAETALARANVMLGDSEDAVLHAERALEVLGTEHRLESARAHLVLAAAHLRRGDRERAQAACERAALLLEASEATRQAAFAWSELAEVLEENGESERAVRAYRESMRLMGHRSRLTGGAHRSSTTGGAPRW
ncbi:helix-turn-helix domain-containing protein [Umezawaea tangerina]|uniref:Helix-turn-helix protein n=1 Tax=Umezawaea tangerina TaxID=84725 RepID=A0A2T0SVR8_9PSEU|nr:helix-turn-helix domain-containing protein [Umezawaea tangerina]PRY37514.1 helix-turn-helix protein [Umezawaea tangerina]